MIDGCGNKHNSNWQKHVKSQSEEHVGQDMYEL